MVGLLCLTFFITAILVFLEKYLGKYKWYVWVTMGTILVLMATFKVIGNDDDSEAYERMYFHYDDIFIEKTVEPSFRLLAEFLNPYFHDVHIIFFIYAVIGITLKFVAIARLSPVLFLPLLVFLGHFFNIHDMIEIRASVAIAILFFAIKPICEKKYLLSAGIILLATFIHYSALVAMPLLLFSNETLSKRWKIALASIVPLGYILFFLNIDVISMLRVPVVGDKLEVYKLLKDYGLIDQILIWKNPLLLIKILCFYALLYYSDVIVEKNKYFPFLMKVEGMAFASFFFFAGLPVLSGRLYELYGAVDILLIWNIIYIFRPRWVGKLILTLLCCITFFFDIFIYNLLR
ncbi:MAG: EpsG family protein [Prevotellaceae bacterium]|nr:EpsG family protein [Prevotellaceae bacterium]